MTFVSNGLEVLKKEAHSFRPPSPINAEHKLIPPARLEESGRLALPVNTKIILSSILKNENAEVNLAREIGSRIEKGLDPDMAVAQVVKEKANSTQENMCGLATAGVGESFRLLACDQLGNKTDLTDILNFNKVLYVTMAESQIASIYTKEGRVRFDHEANLSYVPNSTNSACYFPNECAVKCEVFFNDGNFAHKEIMRNIDEKLKEFSERIRPLNLEKAELVEQFDAYIAELLDDATERDETICFNVPQAKFNNNRHYEFGLIIPEPDESKSKIKSEGKAFKIVTHISRGLACEVSAAEYRGAIKRLMLTICPHAAEEADIEQLENDRKSYVEKLMTAPVKRGAPSSSENDEVDEVKLEKMEKKVKKDE